MRALRALGDYLKDRSIVYDTADGPIKMEITSGAARGSMLGPNIWNVSYDGILCIEMPEGTFLVRYADDIAVVIRADSKCWARVAVFVETVLRSQKQAEEKRVAATHRA